MEESVMSGKGKALVVLLGLALTIGLAVAQKNKPWTGWTLKDAQKILNDSAWGQTQADTDTTEMMFSPAARDISSMGAVNQATSVYLRVRLLSAKPIRLAFFRQVQLNPKHTQEQLAQAQAFVDRKYDQTIVVAVTYDGTDQRYTAPYFQALNTAITSTLKNTTYLETKGGKRNFLLEYQSPAQSQDGVAKFIFARIVDDKPYVELKGNELRFYAELPKLMGNNQPTNNRKDSNEVLTINMRFKIANLMYEGVLEY
jgi:hypothetical protein